MTMHARSGWRFGAVTLVVTLAAAFLWLASPGGAQAVDIDRGSRDYTLPDQMHWRDTDTARIATLHGDPARRASTPTSNSAARMRGACRAFTRTIAS